MTRKFEDAIKISISRYARKRAELPKALGNDAMNHFKDNFRKQGYEDSVVKAWVPRKKVDSGRAILVKSGRLRRSFAMTVISRNRIQVINDTPYSVYHNYGNPSRNLHKRQFMGKSRNLDEKAGVRIMRMIKGAL